MDNPNFTGSLDLLPLKQNRWNGRETQCPRLLPERWLLRGGHSPCSTQTLGPEEMLPPSCPGLRAISPPLDPTSPSRTFPMKASNPGPLFPFLSQISDRSSDCAVRSQRVSAQGQPLRTRPSLQPLISPPSAPHQQEQVASVRLIITARR